MSDFAEGGLVEPFIFMEPEPSGYFVPRPPTAKRSAPVLRQPAEWGYGPGLGGESPVVTIKVDRP